MEKPIGKDTTRDGWLGLDVDLSEFAGKTTKLELVNNQLGVRFPRAFWAEIAIESK